MATQNTFETVNCVACGEQHPRSLSVVVVPSGLACGLACMTPQQRELFGLPNPEDAAIGVFPTPPYIQGWRDNPSRYFTITMTDCPGTLPKLEQHHFRHAINRFGLTNTLKADYRNPASKMELDIQGTPVTFAFSVYTAAERLHVWIDATTSGDNPTLLGGARLSWTRNPNKPEREQANRNAVEFLHSNAQETPAA